MGTSDKEADGQKSDEMSIGKPLNHIYFYNNDSPAHSVPTPSDKQKQNSRVQLPASSFMQGVESLTQSGAVDVSFIQVDTSCMSYSFIFYCVSY